MTGDITPPSSTGGLLTLDATPAAIGVVAARTAVVVVDMQNDFGAEGGMVDLAGDDLSVLRATIGPTARVLAAARRAGIQVIYTQHGYRPDLSDMGPQDSKNWIIHEALNVGKRVTEPDGSDSRILVRDTWNTRIVPELAPEDGDIVLGKTRFSGFHNTELDATLQRLRVRSLLVAGWTTSDCVEATVRDAMLRDYRTILLADCTGEPHGPAHYASTVGLIAKMHGWVSDSTSFLKALRERDEATANGPGHREAARPVAGSPAGPEA